MSPRISGRFAWSVCGLTLVMIACTLALFVQPASASLWPRPTPNGVDPGGRRSARVGPVQTVAGLQKRAAADIQSGDVRDAGG